MRIITLEEHVSLPEITKLIPPEINNGMEHSPGMERVADALSEVGPKRIKSMDKNKISLQVLSVVGPGADILGENAGPVFAQQYNDAIAEKMKVYPTRFAAFAHLPMTAPTAAAEELQRCVEKLHFKGVLINGMTSDEFLDDEKYAPILAKAEALGVPIYLHPGIPPKAVKNIYYNGLPKQSGEILSIAGWGWHSETAIHVLRLIISGTLDKFPKLNIIIGHMGEMLPMMMARCNKMFEPNKAGANQRSISQTLKDQIYITTSGIFTLPPFMVAYETFGIDNILFSVDYPFAENKMGKKFVNQLPLKKKEMKKLLYKNAEKLLGLK